MQRLGLDVTVIEGRWGDGAYEDKCVHWWWWCGVVRGCHAWCSGGEEGVEAAGRDSPSSQKLTAQLPTACPLPAANPFQPIHRAQAG